MIAEFDLPAIAQRMLDLGIMDKPFRELSREEALELCLAVHGNTKRRSLQPVALGSQGAATVPGV
jgi:hypothetical protein